MYHEWGCSTNSAKQTLHLISEKRSISYCSLQAAVVVPELKPCRQLLAKERQIVGKCQGINKVITIHPEGNMNPCKGISWRSIQWQLRLFARNPLMSASWRR